MRLLGRIRRHLPGQAFDLQSLWPVEFHGLQPVRGYEVTTAATGGAALRTAAEHRPDVIVLDLGLPDMSGIEVLGKAPPWSAAAARRRPRRPVGGEEYFDRVEDEIEATCGRSPARCSNPDRTCQPCGSGA
jgi:hypothetical protein